MWGPGCLQILRVWCPPISGPVPPEGAFPLFSLKPSELLKRAGSCPSPFPEDPILLGPADELTSLPRSVPAVPTWAHMRGEISLDCESQALATLGRDWREQS